MTQMRAQPTSHTDTYVHEHLVDAKKKKRKKDGKSKKWLSNWNKSLPRFFCFYSLPGLENSTRPTRRVSRSKYRRPLKSKIMDPFFFSFFFPRILHCLFFFFSLIFRYRDERYDDKKKNCNPFPISSDFRQGYFLEKRDYKSKT